MYTKYSIFFIFIAWLVAIVAGNNGLRGAERVDSPLSFRLVGFDAAQSFRITLFDDLIQKDDGTFVEKESVTAIPIMDGSETSSFYSIDLPQNILDNYADAIEEGDFFISATGATMKDDKIEFDEETVITVLDNKLVTRRKLSLHEERTVAVIRVSVDSGPWEKRQVTYSAREIEQHLFNNEVSMKSQYRHCSNGQLELKSAGVYEVTVPGQASDYPSPASLRNKALDILAGLQNVPSASFLADHVMVILPPNDFPGFIGNAGKFLFACSSRFPTNHL